MKQPKSFATNCSHVINSEKEKKGLSRERERKMRLRYTLVDSPPGRFPFSHLSYLYVAIALTIVSQVLVSEEC
jgi:hypothetical protein